EPGPVSRNGDSAIWHKDIRAFVPAVTICNRCHPARTQSLVLRAGWHNCSFRGVRSQTELGNEVWTAGFSTERVLAPLFPALTLDTSSKRQRGTALMVGPSLTLRASVGHKRRKGRYFPMGADLPAIRNCVDR